MSIDRLALRHILTLSVVILLLLGVLMVQSASAKVGGPVTWHWEADAVKQLYFAGAGLLVFLVVGLLDDRKLLPLGAESESRGGAWIGNPVNWLMLGAIVLSVAVFVPGIGDEANGAKRWIRIAGFNFQPSEIAKWAVVAFLADRLARKAVIEGGFFRGTIWTLLPVGFLGLLIVVEDFGTAALIGAVAVAMLLVGRVKWWHLAVLIPPALIAAYAFVRLEPYRWRRMTNFTKPFEDPAGEGYHMVQSLLSFSTGGLFGTGLGNGVQKLGYLPEDTTDFIFAVICEELGLFGAVFTLGLYLAILFVAWQGLRLIVQKTKSGEVDLGRLETRTCLLVFGISLMVGLQALINVAVATVSVPTKGLSLPLVSSGGSGLILACGALGLLHAIIRRAEKASAVESETYGENQTENPPMSTHDLSTPAVAP